MTSYGLKLMSEIWGPGDLVRQATAADAAGFDFVGISDHFHPWLEDQGHAPSAWTVLGAIAQATERVELATAARCAAGRDRPGTERVELRQEVSAAAVDVLCQAGTGRRSNAVA